MPYTIVTTSVAKVGLCCNWVWFAQVLLCLDPYDTDAIAINKL